MVDLLCASSELVSLLRLVKPPLIYVLRGHDIGDEDKYGTRCKSENGASNAIPKFDCHSDPNMLGPRWMRWLTSFELFADGKGLIITEATNATTRQRR